MTIEQKIRAIMKATGWKQQKLAEHFRVSQSTVNRWLSGSEPEGPRRDAINETYAAHVNTAETEAAGSPIREADAIRELLHRIEGLKPDNVTVLLSAIQGFQQANGVQPLPSRPDDQSGPAIDRRESAPTQRR